MVKRFIIILAVLAYGPVMGLRAQGLTQESFKIGKTLALLEAIYVDSVDISAIAEQMIITTLRNLDPHSVYFSHKYPLPDPRKYPHLHTSPHARTAAFRYTCTT